MKLTEKMSYLKGYIEGLNLDPNANDGKLATKLVDLMDEMVGYIEDLQNQVDELSELCEALDEDLGEVEQEVFCVDGLEDGGDGEDEDDDYDVYDGDDQLYEAICPTCGRTIVLDDAMLSEGGIECACGESLEFDFESLDEDLDEKELEDALDIEMLEDLEGLDSLDD
jgi:hypothetical protein